MKRDSMSSFSPFLLLLFVLSFVASSHIINGWTILKLPARIQDCVKQVRSPRRFSMVDPRSWGPYNESIKFCAHNLSNEEYQKPVETLLNVLLEPKFEEYALESLKDAICTADMTTLILLEASFGAVGKEETWANGFACALHNAKKNGNGMAEIVPVLRYVLHAAVPAYSEELLILMEDAVTDYLATKLDSTLLDLLMEDKRFPIARQGNVLSDGWLRALARCIRKGHFVFFRRIVSDWSAFKARVNLSLPCPTQTLMRGVPVGLEPLILLMFAVEQKKPEFIWMLVSRTNIFRRVGQEPFASSKWGKVVFSLIPELRTIKWKQDQFNTPENLTKFLSHCMEHGTKDHESFMSALLCSSLWNGNMANDEAPLKREQFVNTAINSCNGSLVIAAARRGLLNESHLQSLYRCQSLHNLSFFKRVDSYCGMADIVNFKHKGEASLIVYLAQTLPCLQIHSKKLAGQLMSRLSSVGPLELMWMLDELNAMQLEEKACLMNMPVELSTLLQTELSLRTAVDDSYDLLCYLFDNGHKLLLASEIKHMRPIILTSCLSFAIQDSFDELLQPLLARLSLLTDYSPDAPSAKATCELMIDEGLLNGIGMAVISGARFPSSIFKVCQSLGHVYRKTLFYKAVNDCNRPLVELLLWMIKTSLDPHVWLQSLHFAWNDAGIFGLLWAACPLSSIPDDKHDTLYERVNKEILIPAIAKDFHEHAKIILSHPMFPLASDESVLTVVVHSSPEMFEIVIEAPFIGNIDLSFNSNALLEIASVNGQKALALKLLTDLRVFKMALSQPSEAVFKVFPELSGFIGSPSVNAANRKFLRIHRQ